MFDSADSAAWDHARRVLRPALLLAPHDYLADLRRSLVEDGMCEAVCRHDSEVLFDWIVRLLSRQGISNHAAESFIARHGSPTFAQIENHLARDARCPRLSSYWTFAGCAYRRGAKTCGTPRHQPGCPLVRVPARKGALAEAAFGLALFVRDVCDGDLVNWIDARVASADPGFDHPDRAQRMRDAVLEPLLNIAGTGPKTWSMISAELLLGADPNRERWVTTGASFVAIDSLCHSYLHRTGVLRRLEAEHAYGPACYAPGGCADVIAALAARMNARAFNPDFPAYFPRWVQYAVGLFCAEGDWAICNGNRIDDTIGCQQQFCPSFSVCDKMAIKPSA